MLPRREPSQRAMEYKKAISGTHVGGKIQTLRDSATGIPPWDSSGSSLGLLFGIPPGHLWDPAGTSAIWFPYVPRMLPIWPPYVYTRGTCLGSCGEAVPHKKRSHTRSGPTQEAPPHKKRPHRRKT